ncbi:hypothetical protein ACS5PN_17280 [Roseateles sp. NT4]|uniref:hypothetical protein n=1 Tax=Roseateles sp. NT4 TaxID=3453715 RepID=UPI003EEB425F
MTNIKRLGGTQALEALDDLKQALSSRAIDGSLGLAFDKARREIEQEIKSGKNK